MKSVLISIQPKWVEKICHEIGKENGKPIYEKVVEVRKTRPKLETPFKCYIYCTMGKIPKFIYNEKLEKESVYKRYPDIINGRVIGEFVCDKITDISVVVKNCNENYNHVYHNDECKGSCLTWKELQEYGKGKPLYGWHISDLKIYDKPKELSDFGKPCNHKNDCGTCVRYIRRYGLCDDAIIGPPQSWCYVESGVQCE